MRVRQERVFPLRFSAGFFLLFDGVVFGAAFFKRVAFDGVFLAAAFLAGSFEGAWPRNVRAGGGSFKTVLVRARLAFATSDSAFANRSFS